MSQNYCDIGKAFGCWLEMLMLLGQVETMSVIQSATTVGCRRPLIWYEVTDNDDRNSKLDPKEFFVPSYVAIDLEVMSADGEQVQVIAGNIRAACSNRNLYRETLWGPIYDGAGNMIYEGAKIKRIKATGSDEDYTPKAPSVDGEYTIGTFIEIFT